MKIVKHIIVWVFSIALIASCNEGIDPISHAEPGSDVEAPMITINAPAQGGVVKITEGGALKVDMVAEDDIELQTVSIVLNGTEVENITSFTDYRRYAPIGGYLVEGLETGSYTLQISATDVTGKSTTSDEVAFTLIVLGSFEPVYGEIFYMGFDNHLLELVTITEATVMGAPGFSEGKIGQAYAGDSAAYLSFPLEGLAGDEFSATFWYNVNSSPDRSGILTVSAPSDNGLNRNFGFRFFREGSATDQIFKMNAGNGTVDSWWDGGAAATLKVEEVDWVHMAITISATHAAIYFDGVVVSESDWEGPIDWTDCAPLSIASGEPNFIGWSHFSDKSLIDELRIFNKALTQEEIQAIIDAEQ
jgi:hypothetical protein